MRLCFSFLTCQCTWALTTQIRITLASATASRHAHASGTSSTSSIEAVHIDTVNKPPPQKMIMLPVGGDQAASCLDGSPYAFYIVPGNPKFFNIGIHGGGSPPTLRIRSQPAEMPCSW